MKIHHLQVNRKPAGIKVEIASTSFARLKGWLGRKTAAGTGLLITPCNGIHTIGMKFPIDAVFLDSKNKIIRIAAMVLPWRLIPIVPGARSVLELPAGFAQKLGLNKADLLHFNKQELPPDNSINISENNAFDQPLNSVNPTID